MDSHGLTLFILTLATLTGIFLFARWLGRFLNRFELPPDTRLLVLISFVGVVLVASLNFLWQQSASLAPEPPAKTDQNGQAQKPQTETDLDAYESAAYPDLYGLRQEMLKQLEELHTFFVNVRAWAEEMPVQRPFLQKIIDIRWERNQALIKSYQAIDRSRREFWLHYHTGEDHYVRQMFGEEAVRLQKRIQDALGDSHKFQLEEADAISNQAHSCVDLLNAAKLPKPPKGRANAFLPYSGQNRQRVMDMLARKQENSILANLGQLQTSEAQIRDKLAYMLEYRKINTDLLSEVNELVQTWNGALVYNQYAQYRILFSVETLEILERLGIPANNRNYSWLLNQLRELAPKVVKEADEERKTAAYSYNPDIDHQYRRQR
ncbi:hypothetical protein VSS37_05310 [Candidatus Thiothrix sp. Deng01]|uniref:Uncharacterized protein n=1 Tax=Candidatus Thiothrix phosphatis TaxID=3112415 RepID=A0ABU6CWD8_9GAMM|nr:hypothetical protein [Candidatus Thiothrix sp. Deng01]MEB4590388.1 hypothetical protein [Candidatus Thiothrix sp. Deng01]